MDADSATGTEEILQRHRKEKKELQARIQALKKTATKGDKKKKKEVSEEIAKLDADLERRHAEELAKFRPAETKVTADADGVVNGVGTDDGDSAGEVPMGQAAPVAAGEQHAAKVSKAQRRRDRKANEMKERRLRISEQEADNLQGARHLETEEIRQALRQRNLMINEIPSDGNCLYCAVDDQLRQKTGRGVGVGALREKTKWCLLENRGDFLPFLSHAETGEMLTDDQYDDYCRQVATTNTWGGQVELKALSKALNCRIEVVQSGSPTVTLGDDGPLLTVTYHRHMYGLGAHYNSVTRYDANAQQQPVA